MRPAQEALKGDLELRTNPGKRVNLSKERKEAFISHACKLNECGGQNKCADDLEVQFVNELGVFLNELISQFRFAPHQNLDQFGRLHLC